ncbi:hypothetical protein J9303_12375 [Bacillaceae bacterium Marseille-Q3522]|nr:hypothetical protein [Bacillaceae bacterium Marseille-Q3522]
MDNQEEKTLKVFFSGNINSVIFLNLFFGTLASLIPSGTWVIFIIAVFITVIETIIGWIWFSGIKNKVRYNSLIAFLTIITSGFFWVIPLLRITYGTILFWGMLLIYLTIFVYTLYKRELLFKAFYRPEKSRLAKGVLIITGVVFVIGSLLYRNGQELIISTFLNNQQEGVAVSLIFYIFGLIFTFISSIFLKHPDKIKKH